MSSILITSPPADAISINGTLEARLQADNRFNQSAALIGELWTDVEISSSGRSWITHLSGSQRFSSLDHDSGGRLYQGYLDGKIGDLPARIRAGRFQRTDMSGFYSLDGGQVDYESAGWHLQAYGGKPQRLDHVRSIEGDYVYGFLVNRHLVFEETGNEWMHHYNLTVGYQAFQGKDISRRLQGAFSAGGGIDGRAWSGTLSTTYRFDVERFENVWFDSFVDLPTHLRFRTNYEYYRPRSPFPTFRERFVSAYALGEQSLFRAELHHRPHPAWHYYLGGQRATKADGFDGNGLRTGGDYRWRNLRVSIAYDYLKLGEDKAHSGYVRLSYTFGSRLEAWLNGAVRKEEKLLSGENWSRGGGMGLRFLFDYNTVLLASFNYITNSNEFAKDDYVGVLRLIYYLERFQPKREERCGLSC